MSQDFMDAELFADFIIEAKEHLETIEPNLLELEKAPDNLSLLNDIFRPMHSLKGATGFMGLNKMNALAHRAENVLDELRKGSMAANSRIMDTILAATDALRQMIDSLEADNTEGNEDYQPLADKLDALLTGELPAEPNPVNVPDQEQSPDVTVAIDAEYSESSGKPGQNPGGPVENPIQPAQSTPRPAPGREQGGRSPADSQLWLQSLPGLPSYTLTAFGESHLRDFIEEARENVVNLSAGLLQLEKDPQAGEVVNDIFRYFHNLKGNSGIIGFIEMNSLTHEAETLLNFVRMGQYAVSAALVDILLLAVDVLEAFVLRIDPASGQVTPFDASELQDKLHQAATGGAVEMPASLLAAFPVRSDAATLASEEAGTSEAQPSGSLPAGQPAGEGPAGRPSSAEQSKDASGASGFWEAECDPESETDATDAELYRDTVRQQFATIRTCIAGMREDGANSEYPNATFRSLSTIQNCSSFMGLDELKVYAQRTAGIVDQGRSSGIDFSLMADLLEQECAILEDMTKAALEKIALTVTGEAIPLALPKSSEEAATEAAPAQAGAEGDLSAQEPIAPDQEPAEASSTERNAQDGPSEPAAKTAAGPNQGGASLPASSPDGPAAAVPVTPSAGPAARPVQKPELKAQAKPAKTEETKTSSTIRVDHEKLDHLMNTIGELIINRNRYSMLARQLEVFDNPDVSLIAQNLSETTYAMARISDDLQDTIMKVRMVPVSTVFSRFPRLVRDLSRKSGKDVELVMEGEETELDKSVVEVIGDPLVHLIRNSVDHGIEPEEVRREAGKPVKGTVWLRAYYKGNSVAIEIEDDGKGIDPEKMREVAVRKGIISQEEAKSLDDREAMELIFAPGFSSAEVVTDISGRGVGMDVVRTNIKNLKGSINIASEVGKGTKFTLSLPLTLAIIDALMVEVGREMFAIPLDAVSETTKIEAARLTDVKGRKAVTLRGEVLGIVNLAELLDIHSTADQNEMLSIVIIHDNERHLGLVVDRMLERQEIVIKPLGAYLGDLKGISGATIMGDGSVILILDPHEIYAIATSRSV